MLAEGDTKPPLSLALSFGKREQNEKPPKSGFII